MVLAGLVIALGELVDDAVIDVENIMRRLRLNRETDTPQSAFMVVLNASLEVRSAVVYGSVIVVLVLIPVFFLEGLAGSFFRPLAFSYVLAIMSSLFVALTLTPALALMLLPEASGRQEPSFVKWLKARYRSILPALIMRPKRVISFLVGALLLTLVSVPFLGEEFLPNFKEHDFLMHWVEKPGTSLQAMERITARVSKELRTIPGVRNFGSHIGRSEVADEVVGPNFTELWISIDPEVDYDTTVERIQEVVNGYPGLYRDLLTYLRERIKEVLTGSSATIVVRIYGENLDILHEKASEVRDTIAGVKGVADLKVQPQIMVPQVEVRFRPEAAAYFGLSSGKVREAVGLLVNGVKVGEFYEDQNIFDVVVMGIPHVRNSVNALRSLRIETPTRGMVPLNDVANVIVAPTPNKITRESASRYTEVTCNVQDRDLGSVSREIENIIGTIPFMSGYHPEILGEYVAQKASRNRIIILSIIVIIAIFLVLHASFGSVRLALLVFLALPFALIGGVVSAFIGGGVLSLGSLIGFITVLGISARNSIMLISHYNNLEREEDQPFNQELIIRGAIERLVPILMTALTTGLALVPIIIGGILPGQEIEHPMAIVIIGGLVSSTLLNLIVMPVIYWKFGATNKEKC